MELTWQILVLFQALFSALNILLSRALARSKQAKNSSFAVNAIAFSATYVSGLLILPLIGEVDIQDFYKSWDLYLAAAIIFNVTFILMYKAASYLESAVLTVLATSTALYTLVLAYFIYGEKLSPVQLIGVVILLPCIWYVAALMRKQHKKFSIKDFKDKHWLKGLAIMLLAGLTLTFGHLIEKQILTNSSVGSFMAFGLFLQLIMAWFLFLTLGRSQAHVFRSNYMISGALKIGVVRMLLAVSFFYGLIKSDNLSLITVIANFRIVIVAVLAGWLLGERRFYYRKLAAAAVSVIALSIIFWN